jgi:hypothetical protein
VSGLTIMLRRGRLHHVRGTVVILSPDTPLADVLVSLALRTQAGLALLESSAAAGMGLASAIPAADGFSDLQRIPTGSYVLTAMQKGQARMGVGQVRVDVTDADVEGVVLRVGAPLYARGQLQVEQHADLDLTKVQLQLRTFDGAKIAGLSSLDAESRI